MSQSSQEFVPKKEVEIKFYRLFPPLMNSSPPLSGIYHNIDSIEDSECILENKFSNFDINTQPEFSNQNIFYLSQSFGRVFLNEILEGLLTFKNKSDHEVNLKSLEVTIIVDEKPETRTKKQKYILDIKLPKEGIILDKSEVYSVKLINKLEFSSKYTIYIELKVRSATYDYEFNEAKQRNMVKEIKDFTIDGESIEISITKKLTFEVAYPFKATEKFHNYQMNTCFIELKIANTSIYPLTITDLYINPKSKEDTKLLLVDSLQEISINQSQSLFSDNDKSTSISASKYLTLQPEEEMNVLFSTRATSEGSDLNKKLCGFFANGVARPASTHFCTSLSYSSAEPSQTTTLSGSHILTHSSTHALILALLISATVLIAINMLLKKRFE